MRERARVNMAFLSLPSSVLLALMFLAASAQLTMYDDEDPFQPVTSDETVAVGGTVTLTCRVPESDNSSLQWSNTAQQTLYFGEKRALRDNRIQLHRSTPTELSISISDVQLSDDGEYTCSIFTMPVRTARATVTVLGVPGKPVITGYEDAAQEGSSVTLTCSSSGSKPPAQLHWYRGTDRLEGRPNVVESNPNEPTYTVTSVLTLPVTRDDNNVMIACAVDHPSISSGEKRTEQPLSVLFSPSVLIKPESDLPREGEKFHLQCVGNGNPEPMSFKWWKKDGELPPLVKDDGAFLRFEVLNKSDNGVYLCLADNGVGQGDASYTLLVQARRDSSLLSITSTAPSSLPSTEILSLSSSWDHPDPSLPPSVQSSPLSTSLLPESPPPVFLMSSSPLPALSPTSLSLPSIFSSMVSQLNGVEFTGEVADSTEDPTAMSTSSGVDHAVIGGVVAVIVFIMLCLLIVLGRYLIRHKGTYLTHEAKGSDDAPDADTAIINAEGGHSGADDKKEYFI